MSYSKFMEEFSDRLLKQAAKNNFEYFFHGGKLKKGQWLKLPNGSHAFIVDGKITAGSPNLIGKTLDEAKRRISAPTGQELQEDIDDENNPQPYHPDILKKYQTELSEATMIPQPKARAQAVKRIYDKMHSENAHEGQVSFLTGGRGTNHNLDGIAKTFSDYGDFPEQSSPQDQAIWYNDRLSLLNEMYGHLGKDSKDDLLPIGKNVRDRLEELKKSTPGQEQSSESVPEIKPEVPQTPIDRSIPKLTTPETISVPTSTPSPKISVPIQTDQSVTSQVPPKKKKQRVAPAPKVENVSSPAPSPVSTPVEAPTSMPGSPYGKSGKDIIQTPIEKPIYHRPVEPFISDYRLKSPQIRQDKPYYQAGLRFKTLEMIKVEAALRNAFIQVFKEVEANLDEATFKAVTGEFLARINE